MVWLNISMNELRLLAHVAYKLEAHLVERDVLLLVDVMDGHVNSL
jgi:mRNA-degrading endonuclease HigB of HigAB toxin-antitoxin module